MKEIVESISKKAGEDFTEKLINYYSAALAKHYENAKSYTNLIIAVAYGVFFSLWNTLRGDINGKFYDFGGLLVGISVLFFVLWEVFQMTYLAIHQRRLYKKIGNINPQNIVQADAEITKENERVQTHFASVWIWALIFILLPGLSGVGIFLFTFVSYLAKAT